VRIGLDFDNTLAGYDRVFAAAARAQGYIGEDDIPAKRDIRSLVRALDDGETKWMALQGEVYGKRMKDAELLEGVADFLRACKARGADVVIVSHKTEFGHYDADRVNLRDAARAWMEMQGFFDDQGFALKPANVYFESTRAAKVARIAQLDCTHFVDDLEEVFAEPGFPENVTRILYDPTASAAKEGAYERHTDWSSIEHAILEHRP